MNRRDKLMKGLKEIDENKAMTAFDKLLARLELILADGRAMKEEEIKTPLTHENQRQ